jgi:hyperpolarization activated cyclic nucleotide-gated potassium channel 1
MNTSPRSTAAFMTEEEKEERAKLVKSEEVDVRLRQYLTGKPNPAPHPHYQHLETWRRALFKIKAQKALKKVSEDILVYGTNNELTDMNMQYKTNIDQLIEMKSRKSEGFRKLTFDQYIPSSPISTHLITPNSNFKKAWDLLLALILIYTAIVMPFRLAFYDTVFWDAWTVLDFVIDGLFFVDVVVNFFSVGVNSDGSLETRQGKIAIGYLKGWFWLDITACLPFSLLDMLQSSDKSSHIKYNSLLRLARLPRLYKLFRITRIIKAFRRYRASNFVEKVQDFLQINSRLYKLIKFLISVFVCVHLVGCFWYFTARVDDLEPETWVVRTGHQDDDIWTLYLFSVYWAITTCVTVGYGDITARTELEMVMAMIWMLAGVGFYSFTVGSLSSFLTSIDTRESILAAKMAAIQEFARETGISNACKLKIRSAIKYNTYKTGNVWQDKHSLFNELPKSLRYEVAVTMYSGIAGTVPLLVGKDPAFIIFVLPLFRPMKLADGEYVYKEGDHADEVYLITQGRVNLILKSSEVVYKSFLRGSLIGDVEVLKQTRRISNAICHGTCEFLVLTDKDMGELMREFPVEGREIVTIAREKGRRIRQAHAETVEILKMKQAVGSVESLAGQERVLEVREEEEGEDDQELALKLVKRLDSVETELKASKTRISDLTQTVQSMQRNMQAILRLLSNHQRTPATMLGRLLQRQRSKV